MTIEYILQADGMISPRYHLSYLSYLGAEKTNPFSKALN